MKMKPLSLETIARVSGGKYVGPDELKGTLITGAVRDNREVTPGSMFVCIAGQRADGHDFAQNAFERGAACCLASRVLENAAGPYVLVDSTPAALRRIAAYYRSLFSIPVIGVTGSVGKTTAKEMVSSVLSAKYLVHKTEANLNNDLGVPLTLLGLREEHQAAVIEMGISNFGEMSLLAEMVRPTICLMTAIGYCHLENLGDLDGVLRAKSEVYKYMNGGLSVVCGDDEKLRSFDPGIRKITYGLGAENDIIAENIENLGYEGVRCDIRTGGSSFSVHIPALGSHMVLAALAAAAIGRELRLDDAQIAAGIARYAPVGGRANVRQTGYLTVINDCYNANPNSVMASLQSLSTLKGRKVAVLGDMKELGENSGLLHRNVGACASRLGIDLVICCGTEAEKILEGFVAAGMKSAAHYYASIDELKKSLPSLVRRGDNVLVKASHSMHFEELVDELEKLK